MYDYLLHLYQNYHLLAYPLIVAATVFEGPIVSVMLGSIAKLGYLNVWLCYVAVVLGDMIGDISLYYVGYRYGDRAVEKVQSKFNVTHAQVETIKRRFHTQKYSILFLSKITNGFGLSSVILLTAGIVRVPFLVFASVNFAGQLLWSGVLLFLGYHFVGIYQQIEAYSGKATWVLLGLGAILAVYVWHKYKKSV